jgi:tetratricopeptide (TPR) repeat protein
MKIIRRALQLVKEWGAAATLMIAILYTFPFDVFDRYTKWWDKDVTVARQALSDAASIWLEQAKTTNAALDPRALDVIQRAYQTKFFNVVHVNRDALSRAAPRLYFHEVQQIASLLTMIGQASTALPFFDAAIEKAKREGISHSNIMRDKAQALFMPGPAQDIEEARRAYVEAIRLSLDNRPPDHRMALIFFFGARSVGAPGRRLEVWRSAQRLGSTEARNTGHA